MIERRSKDPSLKHSSHLLSSKEENITWICGLKECLFINTISFLPIRSPIFISQIKFWYLDTTFDLILNHFDPNISLKLINSLHHISFLKIKKLYSKCLQVILINSTTTIQNNEVDHSFWTTVSFLLIPDQSFILQYKVPSLELWIEEIRTEFV